MRDAGSEIQELNLAFIAPRPVWLASIPYGSFFTLLSRSPGPGPIANRHQFRPDSTSFMATRRSLLIRILDRYISICVSLSWNRLGYLSWRAIPGFHIRPWFCLLLVSTLDWHCQHAAVTDPPVACQQRREPALSGKRLSRRWYRQLVRWLCSLTDQQTEQLQHWLLPGNNKTASHWCCTMSYTCNVCEITARQARQANDVMLTQSTCAATPSQTEFAIFQFALLHTGAHSSKPASRCSAVNSNFCTDSKAASPCHRAA